MASPFSRTTRSVAADHIYVSLASLIVAIILAIIWGRWFFTAKITFYETSQRVIVTNDESIVTRFPQDARGGTQRAVSVRTRRIVAEFPPETKGRIQVGQPALLVLKTSARKQTGALTTVVDSVVVDRKTNTLQVELTATLDAERPNPFKEGPGGELRVESGYVTPARLVMQASGLFTDAPPTTFSPQKARTVN